MSGATFFGGRESGSGAVNSNVETETYPHMIFDSLMIHFDAGVFFRQLLGHMGVPISLFVLNPTNQGFFNWSFSWLYPSYIIPFTVLAMIVFYNLSDYTGSGALWIPLISYTLQKVQVALKYAAMSPTEYKRFMTANPETAERYQEQMMLFSGWFSRRSDVCQFELSAAAMRCGIDISTAFFVIPNPATDEQAYGQFLNWKALLSGHDRVSEDSECPSLVQHKDGTYTASVFETCVGLVKQADRRAEWFTNSAYIFENTATLIIVAVQFIVLPKKYSIFDILFLVTSTLVLLFQFNVVMVFMTSAIFDAVRQRYALRLAHDLIRLSDLYSPFNTIPQSDRQKQKVNQAVAAFTAQIAHEFPHAMEILEHKDGSDNNNNNNNNKAASPNDGVDNTASNNNTANNTTSAKDKDAVNDSAGNKTNVDDVDSDIELAQHTTNNTNNNRNSNKRNSSNHNSNKRNSNNHNSSHLAKHVSYRMGDHGDSGLAYGAFTTVNILNNSNSHRHNSSNNNDNYSMPRMLSDWKGKDAASSTTATAAAGMTMTMSSSNKGMAMTVDSLDGDVALIPRVSLAFKENLTSATYTSIILQYFGDRFRFRLDLFVFVAVFTALALIASVLVEAFTGDQLQWYSSVSFYQSLVFIFLAFVLVLFIAFEGARTNKEVTHFLSRMTTHALRLSQMKAAVERRLELEINNNTDSATTTTTARQQSLQQRVVALSSYSECIQACLDVVQVHREAKPLLVLGIPASFPLLSSLISAFVTFFATVFSAYYRNNGLKGIF